MKTYIETDEQYTVEVSGVFHVYAESQEQANEYIENKLDKGDSGYTGSLEISGGDLGWQLKNIIT